jgi:hypothetical protein
MKVEPEKLRDNLLVDEDYQLLSDYAFFKGTGLRKEAKNSVNLFLKEIAGKSKEKKLKLVRMLCSMQYETMETFMSYPLKEEFMKPVLLDWINEEPQNAVPYKYLAKFSSDEEALPLYYKSYALNPDDDSVLCNIIYRESLQLYDNTHYLDEIVISEIRIKILNFVLIF